MIEILEKYSLPEGLSFVANQYPGKVVFSTSFGQEDQVITDAIFRNEIGINIFTLDTGRLFQETYELIDRTRSRYKKNIEVFYPNTEKIQALVSNKGANSFYESVENRKECCFIRKIEPLKRALAGAEVWITGLRAEQSENRNDMKIWEWDEGNKVWKFNPLIHWTYEEVLKYIAENKVPDNPLHKKGFVSIGCLPCTRAIEPHEHPRAGRWWWEESKKECGLHAG
ncbi:adenylylsulfate reductase, thioredoxin dependent [Emticicia oligotrophica DSM 17448]|uniref:Adenosine 5'-phosphosulfate reductase n=1 Tax=Emticicia oligotrophica (strain DSM 17448 / CIP 109782 / MTCC 6937 / GPTSA100-15) TaxID=929562 RepID=A0ABM5N695_EMTOG|nr:MULTISPECIES: phosphoadenylyl-sulfate reductase [Emticicia]AFK05067.1 adenylylsulfate reductase, thioredoxin dependent [Emticicia oligotrophica DSM 17448]